MNRDERKRKFNEAIINMLYPSSPQRESSPPPPQVREFEPLIQGSASDVISGSFDECENASTSTSSDEEDECGTEKLTRAQRKKIRKKKIKEEAIRRGKLIGPLLHPIYEAAVDPPAVRSNAASEERSGTDEPGDEVVRAASKKTKNRRVAKRLAKEKPMASTSDNRSDDHASISAVSSSVDPNKPPM